MVQNAALNLSYCHIVAPFDGRTGLRLVDPGNIIQTGSTTPLVTIAQLAADHGDLRGRRGLPAADRGAAAEPRDAETWTRSIAPRRRSSPPARWPRSTTWVDTTTGTVRLRAQFENKDGALFPNQFVNARILVKTIHDATLVPSAAVAAQHAGRLHVRDRVGQGVAAHREGGRVAVGTTRRSRGSTRARWWRRAASTSSRMASPSPARRGGKDSGKDQASSTDGGTKAASGPGSAP